MGRSKESRYKFSEFSKLSSLLIRPYKMTLESTFENLYLLKDGVVRKKSMQDCGNGLDHFAK